MKICEIMRHCAAIERLIAEVYQTFAMRWPEAPWGDFWQRLANEELGHGRILDDLCRVASDRDEPSIDASRLRAIREHVEDSFPLGTLSIDQALGLALDLEELELDNVYRRLFAITADDSRAAHAIGSALAQVGRHEQSIVERIERSSHDPALVTRAGEVRRRALKTPTQSVA